MQHTKPKQTLSILAAIRLDQARRGLRVVTQADVRRYEKHAAHILKTNTFAQLAGLR